MSATQWSQSSYLTDLIAAPQTYELLQALRLVQYEINMGNAPIEIRYRDPCRWLLKMQNS